MSNSTLHKDDSSSDAFSEIPQECISEIIRHLESLDEWIACKRVSRNWSSICDESLISLKLSERSFTNSKKFLASLKRFKSLENLVFSSECFDEPVSNLLQIVSRSCPSIKSFYASSIQSARHERHWNCESVDSFLKSFPYLHSLSLLGNWKNCTLPNFEKFSNLKHLKLSFDLSDGEESILSDQLSSSLKNLFNLQSLQLQGLTNLSSHGWDFLYSLHSLTDLELSFTHEVTSLSVSLPSNLHLSRLHISGLRLTNFPTMANSSNLTSLSLMIDSLPLPLNIWSFTQLTELTLRLESSVLMEIPSDLAELTALERLEIRLPELRTLPNVFDKLTNLTYFRIHCGNLLRFPPSLWLSPSLTELHLRPSRGLRTLPPGVGNLHSLKSLSLVYFCIAEIPNSVQSLTSLQYLFINGGYLLTALPKCIGALTSLNILHLSILGLETLPELTALVNLKHLIFQTCEELEYVSDLCIELPNLESLKIWKCSKLYRFESFFSSLTYLRALEIHFCPLVQTFSESFGQLEMLTTIKLHYLNALSYLPESFSELKLLRRLHIGHCDWLGSLPVGLIQTSLEILLLHDCRNLVTIPEPIFQLKTLVNVSIDTASVPARLPANVNNLFFFRSKCICSDDL